ncbi:ribonuclease [Erythrobacter sp. QSSC1-22B]|uniref:ribonuclease n=1 Tax=Erythrobacter sp. QSSC1-22B TaxID=1860125 RepID=UPI000804AC13|nr:ribonuclease [Erythrobacter sp. QSSC1-22B]OBX20409.1 ribonuclease [Erythrobacter sp. QSSC1-22B]
MTWYVERGIAEERAVLIERGRVVAGRLHWPGALTAGQVEDAVLVSRAKGSHRGTLRFASGEEALVDRLPATASEGAAVRARVTRAGTSERDRIKLAHAIPTDEDLRPAPTLAEQLALSGHSVETIRRFPDDEWEELWLEAWSGAVAFDGGELAFFDTSAMVLIDVDGPDDPRRLALAAVPSLAEAIGRFDLAGSIGVDFPTLAAKADRKAVDGALDQALAHWNHERTAMNGFGFVQMVARAERPSLLRRLHHDRAGAAARLLLRRADFVAEPGCLLLTAHPAVLARLQPEWQTELARRTGRAVMTHSDPRLALEGGFAQAVTT